MKRKPALKIRKRLMMMKEDFTNQGLREANSTLIEKVTTIKLDCSIKKSIVSSSLLVLSINGNASMIPSNLRDVVVPGGGLFKWFLPKIEGHIQKLLGLVVGDVPSIIG